MNRQTTIVTKEQRTPKWWVVDATDLVLGRLSAKVAMVLQGKHKPQYTPNVDTGDFVVVLNADKIRLTGNKADNKFFQTYTYYTSGQKNFSYRWMLQHKPDLLLERSIRRMMPKTKMGAAMMKKLKIYRGTKHDHQAQAPEPLTM